MYDKNNNDVKNVIRLKDFSFSYDEENKILQNISLEIKAGERILILGPSGCGKSTLTLCLDGIIPQLIDGRIRGLIEVNGMDVTNTPVSVLSQKVGIVFQDPESQFCMLKVEDEVAFGLENLMYERKIMKEKIADSLNQVEMFPYSNWILNNLSGGMKQRIAIASLLAINQDILIFDEPTSNLDPYGTREVSEIIKRLPRNKTLIIIEHKLDEFIDIFDKILLLDSSGRKIAFSSPEQIFLNYMQDIRETGVWIPQIPKFFYNLFEDNIIFDSFPLDKADAKILIGQEEENRGRILDILQKEIKKEILPQNDLFSEDNIRSNNILNNNTPDNNIPYILKYKTKSLSVIEVENLSYRFANTAIWALQNLNFTVNKGDFMGIVGENGSGKTTLAKLLINLYAPDKSSRINIYKFNGGNQKLASKDEITDFTGFVFQNPEHQFVEDSVYKEIIYGLKLKGLSEDIIAEKANKFLKIMGLEKLKEANPFNLSQGQKRKLSVASILIMDYEILILDEPTFGLDYITTINLMNFLKELNQQGKTIIIITHDMNIIFKYTRNVLVLQNGKSAYSGSTNNLINKNEIISSCGLSIPPLYELYKEVTSFAVL
jgi:energy-coupling factor transport system ATP-binding protein